MVLSSRSLSVHVAVYGLMTEKRTFRFGGSMCGVHAQVALSHPV
jgi:hypothetical protein